MDDAFASELDPDPPATKDDPDELVEDMSDPSGQAQVRAAQHVINESRKRLNKRREELYRQADTVKHGPRGEKRSADITKRVEMVQLKRIIDDSTFVNLRLPAEEDKIQALAESMKHEGLKVPITLIAISDEGGKFFVRAGFRRTAVARQLGWKQIPAVILPANTPTVEEYWTNVIENSNRSQLHTYEIAIAAQTMRDKFHVTPLDFAIRAGYTEGYIHNLLRCLDRLPEEIIDAWRGKAKIPIDHYIKWALLEPDEAVKAMLSYAGHNPRLMKDWTPPVRRPRQLVIKMATSRGLQRMQKIRFAVEVARQLDPNTRTLCLKIVDFCSGAREDVPGVYNPLVKQRRYKDRHKEDLKLPETDQDVPPPTLDDDDQKGDPN